MRFYLESTRRLSNRLSLKVLVLMILVCGGCSTLSPNLPSSIDTFYDQKTKGKLVILDHKIFKIHYDSSIRLARYVEYKLSKSDLRPTSVQRRDRFIADPKLVEEALSHVVPDEYKKTGYDKGHLAPSGDFVRTQEQNDLTFVMSNMVPQLPRLNRDSWRLLELKVRGWACGEERIKVYTGPIIGKSKKNLPSGLVVPEKFFKIVIDETPPHKSIAFVFDQTDSKALPGDRIVAINEIESIIGIEVLSKTERKHPQTTNLADWSEVKCYKQGVD